MGRPPSCNPCCGQWYTTEKLTYDDGIVKLADVDFFKDHPLTSDNDYYGTLSNRFYDYFTTWSIFPNTDGGVTVFSKDNLKECIDIQYDSRDYNSNRFDDVVVYDKDAENILPHNRRYNANLRNKRDVTLDYGEFEEPENGAVPYPNPANPLYYRNYDNPDSDDIIWYQSIIDNLAAYDFESVYNAAFAVLNPAFRAIPADFVWSEDNESTYTLLEYVVSDKIYCYFRLGHALDRDPVVNPYDSIFLFVLDFDYSVESYSRYENSVINDLTSFKKTVLKNNKLYSMVLGDFTSPSRNFDFVVIDLTDGLQDRFTGGVDYEKYYTLSLDWYGGQIDYYSNEVEALDNIITFKVASSNSIVEIPGIYSRISPNGIRLDDVEIQSASNMNISQYTKTLLLSSAPITNIPIHYDRLSLEITSDNAEITLKIPFGDSFRYLAYRFTYDTFFSDTSIFAYYSANAGDNGGGVFGSAREPMDFDVDSNGFIYIVGHFRDVLTAANNNQNDIKTLLENNGMRPNGTEYADIIKINGTTGAFVDSATYSCMWLYRNITYLDRDDNNKSYNAGLQSRCIAVTEDGIWVGGDQVWPSFGFITYAGAFEDYYNIANAVSVTEEEWSNRRDPGNRTIYLDSSDSYNLTKYLVVGRDIDLFKSTISVPYNTDAITIYQAGLIIGANSNWYVATGVDAWLHFGNQPGNNYTSGYVDYDVPYNFTSIPYEDNQYAEFSFSGGPILNNDFTFQTIYKDIEGFEEYISITMVIAGLEYDQGGYSQTNYSGGFTYPNILFGTFFNLDATTGGGFSNTTPLMASYPYNLLLFDFDMSLKDVYYFGPSDMSYEKDSCNYMMSSYTSILKMCAIGNDVFITGGRRHDKISTSTGLDLDGVPS